MGSANKDVYDAPIVVFSVSKSLQGMYENANNNKSNFFCKIRKPIMFVTYSKEINVQVRVEVQFT